MFVCFIDFSKAFDKVNYWKPFRQLLDDGVNTSNVSLLFFGILISKLLYSGSLDEFVLYWKWY